MSAISRPLIPYVVAERIKADVCKLRVLFYTGAVPLDVSAQQFELSLLVSGRAVLVKNNQSITRTKSNELEILLTDADKDSLAQKRYQFTLTNVTKDRTELQGVLVFVGVAPSLSNSAQGAPDIKITYNEAVNAIEEVIPVVRGIEGQQGFKGWSPVFSSITDGARVVQKITDWIGGAGAKPATGQFIGATGLVSDIASAVDMRGPQGLPGVTGGGGNYATTPVDGGLAVRFLPVLTLPADSGGSYDVAIATIIVGSWTAPRQTITIQVSNRGGFAYRWSSSGTPLAGASVEAYRNTDQTVTLYARIDNGFKTAQSQVNVYIGNQVAVYGALIPLAGAAPGTKVFDSALPNTYLPMSQTWSNKNLPLWTLDNMDGIHPADYMNDSSGRNQLALGSNCLGGYKDLSLINANIAGNGFAFHQMTGPSSRSLLAVLNSAGNFGLGNVLTPSEKLHVKGNQLLEGILKFPDVTANRKIVLYGNAANNDHQFYGLGVGASQLRYQVDSSSGNHVFLSGSSPATSNELARISGNGNFSVGDSNANFRFKVVENNPANGVLVALSNSRTTAGRTGTKILFDQSTLASWRMGMPADADAFVIEGYAAGAFPEYMRINAAGETTFGGAVLVGARSKSSWPTTADVPTGKIVPYKNTTSNERRLYWNDGGTMVFVGFGT